MSRGLIDPARFDDDDAKWRSYNEWLARINAGGH